jgi:hypothetical protein
VTLVRRSAAITLGGTEDGRHSSHPRYSIARDRELEGNNSIIHQYGIQLLVGDVRYLGNGMF